ncbi:hypothetical protein LR004_01645, partial [Candidatus Gracilibacteria bacterium]|nr:hypothetical protein [Candidatus Gracilibacteria bacterium]
IGGSLVWGLIPFFVFILTGGGLYFINKKIGEKHAWLSWIPLIQIYMIYKAGGKSFFMYFVMPILIMALANWGMSGMSQNSGGIGLFMLFLVPQLLFLIFYIVAINGISKRTGNGFLTTIGFFFLPFVFFPLIGYKSDSMKLKEINNKIKLENSKKNAAERKKDLNIQDDDLDSFN